MSAPANTITACPECKRHHAVAEAEHWQRIMINGCPQRWFVLQPKRNGPFVLWPIPTQPGSRWSAQG
jgi:hypothetical protein